MKLITAAQIVGYNRKKDRSVSLRFETCEKSSAEIAGIDAMLDMFGYLYFKPENKLTNEEIKELDGLDTDLFDNPKTQSQRLRNVLHVLNKQSNNVDFKDFYKSEMDRIINHYKSKLKDER